MNLRGPDPVNGVGMGGQWDRPEKSRWELGFPPGLLVLRFHRPPRVLLKAAHDDTAPSRTAFCRRRVREIVRGPLPRPEETTVPVTLSVWLVLQGRCPDRVM